MKSRKFNFTKERLAGVFLTFMLLANFASAQSFLYLKNSAGELTGTIVYNNTFFNKYIYLNSYCAIQLLSGISCEVLPDSSPYAEDPKNAVRLVNPKVPVTNLGPIQAQLDDVTKKLNDLTNPKPISQNQNYQVQDAAVPDRIETNQITTSAGQSAQSTENSSSGTSSQPPLKGGVSAPQYNSPNVVYQVIEKAVPGPQGPAGPAGRDGNSGGYSSLGSVVSQFFPNTTQGSEYIGYGSGDSLNSPEKDGNFKNLNLGGNILAKDATFSGNLNAANLIIASSSVANVSATAALIISSTLTNATSTNFYAANSNSVNLSTANASITNSTIGTLNVTNNYTVTSNASTTNASTTNTDKLLATFATITNSTSTNIFSTNGSITNFYSNNLFTAVLNSLSGFITTLFGNSSNFVVSNASTSNATSSNAVTGNFTNLNSTNAVLANATFTNATSTNSFATNGNVTNASVTNLTVGGTNVTNIISNLSTTLNTNTLNSSTSNASTSNSLNANISFATITNATITNNYYTNSSGTNSTSTNLFATNASVTTFTSTSIFSNILNSVLATITTLWGTTSNFAVSNASTTNATTGNFTNLNSTNSTNTNSTSTSLFSSVLSALSASFTNLISSTAVITSATFTNATATNFSASNFNVSTLTLGTVNGWLYGVNGVINGSSSPTVGYITATTSTSTFLGINSGGSIIPTADAVYDLGDATHRFKSLYVSSTTIYIDGTALSNNSGLLTWAGSGIQAITGTSSLGATTLSNATVTSTLYVSSFTNLGGIVFATTSGKLAQTNALTYNQGSNTLILTGGINSSATSTFSTIDMASTKIVNLGLPTNTTDAANKAYVDSFVQGITYQAPVIALSTTTITSSTTGDRYIIQTGSSGTGCSLNTIAQNISIGSWSCFVPSTGTTAFVDNGVDTSYNYNGTTWNSLGSTVNHNMTSGLQGGQAGEYYHLNSAQYTALNNVNAQLQQLQTTGNPTFNSLTLTNGLTIATGTLGSATATNLFVTNSSSTNIFANIASLANAYIVSLFGVSSNFVTSNASTSNASTSNAVTFNGTTGNFTTLNSTNLNSTNSTNTNSTSTNLYVSGNFTTASSATFSATSSFSTTTAASSTITNLNSTNINSSNSTITNSTSSNSFATTASSTNLFSTFATLASAYINSLFGNTSNFQTANASTSNATTSNSVTSNVSGTLSANIINALTAALTNLFATNATFTNATTTNLAISGSLRDSSNSGGTNGYILQSTGTSTLWVATSSLGISGGGSFSGSTLGVGTSTNIYGGALTIGETLNGSLVLSSTSTPATTTNALYNNNGTLYWNGTAVGTGSGSGSSSGGAVVYFDNLPVTTFLSVGSDSTGNIIYVTGQNASSRFVVMKSINAGTTWTTVYTGSVSDYSQEFKVSNDGSKIVILSQRLLISTDGGATWSTRGPTLLSGMTFSADGSTIYATYNNGGGTYFLAKSTDNGVSFTNIRTLAGPTATITTNIDGTVVLYVDYNSGVVYRSSDSGATWAAALSSASSQTHYITLSSDGTTAYSSDIFSVYKSLNGGASWSTINFTSPGGRLAVSADGSNLAFCNAYSTDKLTTHTLQYTDGCSSLSIASTGKVVAVNGLGTGVFTYTIATSSGSSSSFSGFSSSGYFTNLYATTSNASTSNILNLSATNATTSLLTLSGLVRDSFGTVGGYGQILMNTGTSTQWVATSSLGISSSGGGATSVGTLTSGGIGSNQAVYSLGDLRGKYVHLSAADSGIALAGNYFVNNLSSDNGVTYVGDSFSQGPISYQDYYITDTGIWFGVNGSGGLSYAGSTATPGSQQVIKFVTSTSVFTSKFKVKITTSDGGFGSDGGSSGSTLTLGSLDGLTKVAGGATISGTSLYLQTADASFPGLVSTTTQTFAGNKTFTGTTTFSGGVDLSGGITGMKINYGSATACNSTVDNVVPVNGVINFTSGGACRVAGISGGTAGKIVYIHNSSASQVLAIYFNSSSILANNLLSYSTDSVNSQIYPGGTATFIYSSEISRWYRMESEFDINVSSLTTYSDQNLKTNISSMSTDTLAKFININPVTFNWNETAKTVGQFSTSTQYSVVAQELQTVFPDLVSTSTSGYLQINFQGLTVYTMEAVKEIALISGTFKINLIAWLGDATNGIKEIISLKIKTKILCLSDDTGDTCINRSQFNSVFGGNSAQTTNLNSGSSINNSTSTSTTTNTWVDTNASSSSATTTASSTSSQPPLEGGESATSSASSTPPLAPVTLPADASSTTR